MLTRLRRNIGRLKRAGRGYIDNHFDNILKAPPELKPFSIGKSVRNSSIECYKIGDGLNKILCVFGIHGNEVGTIKLAYQLLNDAYGKDLKKNTLFIIPCLNIDGYREAVKNPDYLHGGMIGRCNTNNVDLNRNFDTPNFKKESIWSHGKSYSIQTKVYCGESGNSEPETQALTAFIKIQKIAPVLIFHNAGADVLGSNNINSQRLAHLYSEHTGFKLMSDEDWKILKQTGTAKEWCEEENITYIEIEGSTRWASDWKKQQDALRSILFSAEL